MDLALIFGFVKNQSMIQLDAWVFHCGWIFACALSEDATPKKSVKNGQHFVHVLSWILDSPTRTGNAARNPDQESAGVGVPQEI